MLPKKLFFMAVALSAVSLSSCEQSYYDDSTTEEYTRNFIKSYGLIDPNQDWNLAEKATVSVNVGNHADLVKVYAKIDGKYYIMARHTNVTGVENINFCVPPGTTDLRVKVDGRKYDAKIGQTVNASGIGSRTTLSGATKTGIIGGTPTELTVTTADAGYEVFNTAQIAPITYAEEWSEYYSKNLNQWVENTTARGLIPEGVTNNGNPSISEDFTITPKTVTSTGEKYFTIFPMYWHTSHTHELGVYLLDSNGDPIKDANGIILRFPVYKDHEGDNLQVDAKSPNYTRENNATTRQTIEEYLGTDPTSYSDVTENEAYTTKYSNIARSHGITITVPSQISKVGMYIMFEDWGVQGYIPQNHQIGEGYDAYNDYDPNVVYKEGRFSAPNPIFYSQKDLNTHFDDKNPDSYACSFKHPVSGRPFFAFEDWLNVRDKNSNRQSDMDLNDLVFLLKDFDVVEGTKNILENTTPTPPPSEDDDDDEEYTWTLGIEDLGSTDDFDFNDLVIGISVVSENNPEDHHDLLLQPADDAKADTWWMVTFKALAGGGTLPARLYYRGNPIVAEGTGDGEWHNWFGVSTTTMVNTVINGTKANGKSVTYLIQDFDLSSFLDKATTHNSGFKVSVGSGDADMVEVEPQGSGKAPQMILVPGNWKWPAERVRIEAAYSGFTNWVTNAEGGADWYKSPTAGNYYTK